METWLSWVMDGRRHIGPGDGSDPIQLVDVKDVGSLSPKVSVIVLLERSIWFATGYRLDSISGIAGK